MHRFSEALEVLYSANVFSFAGASSVLLFHSLYAMNWRTIRRLHISTVFLVPTKMAGASDCLPPENYNDWTKACTIIGSLDCLQSFKLDMTIWNFYNWKTLNLVDNDSLIAIFQPLQNLVVKDFEIKTNISVDASLTDLLGPLKFRLQQEHRPYGDAFQRY
ncbi:hypothetical protein FB567DRAFT_127170 [Paraphoma chrysanthemicola]|uniref:DUF7730 domain-containing protein n=1 Tax=Paraphoma chrysanthemicola TaxID=798071 RepID=A0A8K0QYF9_9PLEO|nr:hypothetical protein FB567DRAFT_127170 [Paraphoma chrysanthemicola]